MLGTDTASVQAERFEHAMRLSDQRGAVVVLKGCGTLVTEPGGAYAVCPLGNPGMATAGSGDVLTGIVAALTAQGLACRDAARAGVVAHAAAGDEAAQSLGYSAMIASDITAHLHRVLP